MVSCCSAKTLGKYLGTIGWLRKLPANEQADFYAMAKELSGPETVAAAKRRQVIKKEDTRSSTTKSEWLPLAAWKERGYDVEAIAKFAPPEDVDVDPTYGWKLYRVAKHTKTETTSHVCTDEVALAVKGKTRALKRHRTDESSHVGADDEFSPYLSDDSSLARRGSKSKGGNRKAKSKGKAKAKPEDKAEEKAKKQARAAAAKAHPKVLGWVKDLRVLVGNEYILDASPDKVAPVKTFIKQLSDLEKNIQRTKDQGEEVSSCLEEYNAFNVTGMKEAIQALRKDLKSCAKKG